MTTGDDEPENSDPKPVPPPEKIARSEHARLRSGQGRPIGQVVNDVQRATQADVFVQVDDARFVIRGPNAREHIIESDGEHITSIRPRTESAHQARLRNGTIRRATEDEFERLKDMVR